MDGAGEHHLKRSSEGQKLHVLSPMWNIELIQIQQYYERHVKLRGGYIQEGEDKRSLKGEYG
jgi:hypothetical protein